MDQRMLELEARIRTLSERVDVLERRAVTAETGAESAMARGADGVVWKLDPGVTDSPLRVTHKTFDRKRGQLDLMLEITAPLQQPQRWGAVGSPVPVRLRLRAADGDEYVQALTLARGKRLEPGAFVHLHADIDPARAAAAGQLIIEPEDE
ncbi:MAG: hypothetical protein WBM40_18780 [Thiohalocapsa sp.]